MEKANPIDAVLPLITAAVDDWQKANNAQAITERIHAMLDKESEQVVFKLLGFNNSWNRGYELDHCNGRSGNSAAGDYIRKAQTKAIEEWLSAITLPKLTPTLKKQLQTEMNTVYKHSLLDKVRVMAEQRAQQDIDALLHEIIPSKTIDNYIKALQLITPPT